VNCGYGVLLTGVGSGSYGGAPQGGVELVAGDAESGGSYRRLSHLLVDKDAGAGNTRSFVERRRSLKQSAELAERFRRNELAAHLVARQASPLRQQHACSGARGGDGGAGSRRTPSNDHEIVI
jgi:hypothetical protein